VILNKKKILFLSGTRADFGKMKSLISLCEVEEDLEVFIFVTGMHMSHKYGNTFEEIRKERYKNIFLSKNHDELHHMDLILAKTVEEFSQYARNVVPDMIVVHGDRLEALAGAIVGAFNNILVAHIEGGEISGTIDESIRHAISKFAHLHFVANDEAKKRLIQMGEQDNNIFVIGSPDFDIIAKNETSLEFIKDYYEIEFKKYAISLFHPVTTEYETLAKQSKAYCEALVSSKKNYIVIYPNNDLGTEIILNDIEYYFKNNKHFKIFPSLRFEYFSILLKNAEFIIGNSSAGVREAIYYPTFTVNVGNRQINRTKDVSTIQNVETNAEAIIQAIEKLQTYIKPKNTNSTLYGDGKSSERFVAILKDENIWLQNLQKQFMDR
jgi:UDP-N-acetylglucosamine 2-epimerase (hydrolysing)